MHKPFLVCAAFFALISCSCNHSKDDFQDPVTPPSARGKTAPRPLFRDPIFDAPTDPVICFNAESGEWLMYYTQRRATAPNTPGVTWIHGTKIGVAESSDAGTTWIYRGTANITYGQDEHPTDYTYWAPEVIWVNGLYHMYLTYVPGTFNDWNHPRQIVHLTSKDGINWDTIAPLDLSSDRVIDPCVIQLPGGNWRMFYKDERKSPTLSYADSPDLYTWNAKGNAVTDRTGEGPKVIHWQGKYWLIADIWSGQGVWSSDDCTHWTPQEGVLLGNHGDVVINGDRAWWFYFGGETGRKPNIDWAVDPATKPPTTLPTAAEPRQRANRRTTAINVVELRVIDGKLMYESPTMPTRIDLGNHREQER